LKQSTPAKMGYSRSFYIAQVCNCGSFYPGFIKQRGFWPQHRKAVCWLPLQAANERPFPFRNPFIFYTAYKRINPPADQKRLAILQEPPQSYRNERQFNRVIDMLEKQISEKDKTIDRLLTLLEDSNKKKVVS